MGTWIENNGGLEPNMEDEEERTLHCIDIATVKLALAS
jgi:hypothetical protein